jgi:phosphatidylinositol alpha 1,6-mannosyltransferase
VSTLSRSTASHMTGVRLALFTDTYSPQVNGVARTLDRLATALRERGGEVLVFTTDDPAAGADEQVVRIPGRAFPAYPQLRLSWPRQSAVVARLRAFAPTLVHSATEFGVGLAGRRAARALGVPFVSSYHTSFTAYAAHYGLGMLARPGWSYLRWFHNGGRRTYCPTTAIVQEVETHGFERCAVWSRGVDGDRYAPRYRSAAFRSTIGAEDETLVAAYIGRIAPEKNVDVALEATRIAMQARPGAMRLLMVGDGPSEHEVRARAPMSTAFTGRLDGAALSEAFASSDLLLFPSTTDTFGNVMLEAMSSGVPVIGADVGPTREVLLPARGWVTPADDAQAMARVLVSLIDDRNALQQMRNAALAFAATRTWPAVWDALFADYVIVQGGTRAPGCSPARVIA